MQPDWPNLVGVGGNPEAQTLLYLWPPDALTAVRFVCRSNRNTNYRWQVPRVDEMAPLLNLGCQGGGGEGRTEQEPAEGHLPPEAQVLPYRTHGVWIPLHHQPSGKKLGAALPWRRQWMLQLASWPVSCCAVKLTECQTGWVWPMAVYLQSKDNRVTDFSGVSKLQFSNSHVQMWKLNTKKAEHQRTDLSNTGVR